MFRIHFKNPLFSALLFAVLLFACTQQSPLIPSSNGSSSLSASISFADEGISVASFVLFIFWLSGIAGLADIPDDRHKNWKLVASVLIPIYPIIWLLVDMFRQHSHMNRED